MELVLFEVLGDSRKAGQKSTVTKYLVMSSWQGNRNVQIFQRQESIIRKTSPSELFHQGSRSLQVIMP